MAELKGKMEEILKETQVEKYGSPRAVHLLSELTVIYLEKELRAAGGGRANDIHNRLSRLWEEVASHLSFPWTAGQLARRLSVSPAQCFRLCKKFHGSGPMKIVTRMRMQRAKEYLNTNEYSIKQIAGLVGYADPFSFSTAFKRSAGCSPKYYTPPNFI